MANGPEQAKAIAAKDKDANIDGYLVLQMNCWNRVVQTMVETGKPVLYADFLYAGSGGFLVYTAGFLRAKKGNFGFMGSSQFADVVVSRRPSASRKSTIPGSSAQRSKRSASPKPSRSIPKPASPTISKSARPASGRRR